MDRTLSRFPTPSTETIDFAIDDNCDQCGTNAWIRVQQQTVLLIGTSGGDSHIKTLYRPHRILAGKESQVKKVVEVHAQPLPLSY